MSKMAVRKFNIASNEYALFRFSIARPTTLHIRMIATDPVNLRLLDTEGRADYENGERFFSLASWGRRIDLEAAVDVDGGTWYLVVEGSTSDSRGRIEVFQGR